MHSHKICLLWALSQYLVLCLLLYKLVVNSNNAILFIRVECALYALALGFGSACECNSMQCNADGKCFVVPVNPISLEIHLSLVRKFLLSMDTSTHKNFTAAQNPCVSTSTNKKKILYRNTVHTLRVSSVCYLFSWVAICRSVVCWNRNTHCITLFPIPSELLCVRHLCEFYLSLSTYLNKNINKKKASTLLSVVAWLEIPYSNMLFFVLLARHNFLSFILFHIYMRGKKLSTISHIHWTMAVFFSGQIRDFILLIANSARYRTKFVQYCC